MYKLIYFFILKMEGNEENIQLQEKEQITVNIINNEVDNFSEITSNMEFNIMIMGKEGKKYFIYQ